MTRCFRFRFCDAPVIAVAVVAPVSLDVVGLGLGGNSGLLPARVVAEVVSV